MRFQEFLKQSEHMDLVRLSTAGSVDDGKSTLIGRLLHDSNRICDDHLDSLKRDSRLRGSVDGEMDFALLLDGLRAEREQNITIDVAYRYFSTPKRKFIIADTPGHEQYTRNMATGASNADLAIILIDASKGMLAQSKRHSFIMSLFNVQHIVVTVNKMDLVDYSEDVFENIRQDFLDFTAKLKLHDIHFIPLSALHGENVVTGSENIPWYHGMPLLEYLEKVHITSDRNLIDLRFPIQCVLRPNRDFRGYSGSIASGMIRTGDEVMVVPSGRRSRIKSIITYFGEIEEAFPPLPVTVTLEDDIDISRGDMLVHVNNLPHVSNRVEAMVVWMYEEPMICGTQYILKHTTNMVEGQITEICYSIDVNTLHRKQVDQLQLNEIGRVEFKLNRPIFQDIYSKNRTTGSFIIIDRLTNATVGAGIIIDRRPDELLFPAKEYFKTTSKSIQPHKSKVTLEERIKRLNQFPVTLWLTGLPKSGKSTIAYQLEKRLFDLGYTSYVLDDNHVRCSLSSDLGCSRKDQSENIRRAAGVARLCNELGLITITSFVSPYLDHRERARETIGKERFIEIYLTAPLEVCIKRDTEGLYTRAKKEELLDFTGISSSYELPPNPDISLPTHKISVNEAVEFIIEILKRKGFIQ